MKILNTMKLIKVVLSLVIILLTTTFIYSQTVTKVAEINTDGSNFGSNLENFTEFNGKLYFSARGDDEGGYELWEYDGVNAPVQTANINATTGLYGSSPSGLVVFNNKLYFAADDGVNGKELWEYDGTNAPTMVYDINTTSTTSSNPSYLTVFNSKLYFSADDSVSGKELWVYDGTNTPTMVADIFGYGGSDVASITVFNSKLYFSARIGGYQNYELVVYDGVNAPAIAADVNPGSTGSYPSYLTVFNNKLYFQAGLYYQDVELYEYDGINPAVRTADINIGSASSTPRQLIVMNNKLYFQATTTTSGTELWGYDGINAPAMVVDINLGTASSNPYSLVVFDNKLYFSASDGTNDGLWEYNGTTTTSINNLASIETVGVVFNNKLYFGADDGSRGRELWVFDGTTFSLAAEIYTRTWGASIKNLTVFNQKLYFAALNGKLGLEPWQYDGVNTPSMVADIYPGYNGNQHSSDPGGFIELNNKLYFWANDGVSGTEMWMYDGTNPPVLILDICPGSCSGRPNMAVFNNKIIFHGFDSLNGAQLRAYDGINPPTILSNFPPTGNSYSTSLTVFNNKLYFSAYLDSTGQELWVYDGINTPSMVMDIYPGMGTSYPNSSSPSYLTVYNNKLYFSASDVNGIELWEYDGITSPTMAAGISPGISGSSPGFLSIYNNKLLFKAYNAVSGFELWQYDGVNAPTIAADINPGVDGSNPLGMTAYDGKLYFWADNGTNTGRELFNYDGTSVSMIPEINVGPNSSAPINYYGGQFKVFNNKLYFNARTFFEWDDELYVLDNGIGCSIDNTVSLNNQTLTANLNGVGVTYQWIDCTTGTAIVGATNQSFTPVANGRYALVVSNGTCTDTSSCNTISITCNIDKSVTQSGAILTANQLGVAYKWLDCSNGNAVIVGEVSQTFVATSNGNYAVVITDGSCIDTSACINVLDVGVTNINSKNELRVYPNPVSNLLTFEWLSENRGLIEVEQLRIIDMAGRVVLSINSNANTIDVSSLSNGIYILSLQTDKGTALSRFIKE